MSLYPSSAAKSAGLCAIIDRQTPAFASLALAADKGRRADLNRSFSDWKTAAAGRVRDIAMPKLGLFRNEKDARSPWAAPKARSAARVKERLLLTLDGRAQDGERDADSEAVSHGVARTRGDRHDPLLGHPQGQAVELCGVNAQILDGLRKCALVDVMAAIEQFQPQYDPTTSSWAWGRHGLRLSACGIERQEPRRAGTQPSMAFHISGGAWTCDRFDVLDGL
ncbi:unnamed protein product [Closterium sp. NIES-64]|nr:unnamed protein product [Closterium sp. NIES-64]